MSPRADDIATAVADAIAVAAVIEPKNSRRLFGVDPTVVRERAEKEARGHLTRRLRAFVRELPEDITLEELRDALESEYDRSEA